MWRLGLLWLIAAAVAVAIWSPVVIGLQDKAGYAAVMANHRQYVVGLAGWLPSFGEFFFKVEEPLSAGWLYVLRGGLIFLSLSAVGVVRFTWNKNWLGDFIFEGMGLVAITIAVAHPVLLLVFVLPQLWKTLIRLGSIASAISTCWVAGLLVVTPCYAPYPRLWVPWLIGVSLLGGMALSRALPTWRVQFPWDTSWRFLIPGILGATLFLSGAVSKHVREDQPTEAVFWRDRADIVRLAKLLRDEMRDSAETEEFVVYVYGDPALVFQFRLLGLPTVQPVQHFAFARTSEPPPKIPTFLIENYDAAQQLPIAEWKAVGPWRRMERLGAFSGAMSPVKHGDFRGGRNTNTITLLFRIR